MHSSEADPLEATTESNDGERSRGLKMRYIIEIPLFLIIFGSELSGTPISNLIMYRTCVHSLNHTVGECGSFLEPEAINHTEELEKEVQEYTTHVTTVKAVLEGVGPAMLSLFIGVWSDKHGRKPLLVWSSFGIMATGMMVVVYSVMEDYGPWWSIVTIIPTTVVGSFVVLVIGLYCYISDISSVENRSLRIVIIQVTFAVAKTIGNLVSPYLLKAVGTVYLLLIVAVLQTLGYAYITAFIEESMRNDTQGSLLSVLNISHVKEMIISSFEKKRNYGREIMLLLVLAAGLSVSTVYGSHVLLYLYSRNRIEWTMKDFTTFSSISGAMWFMGSFFGVSVIQKRLHISDLNFIAFSFLSCVAEFIIKTLATNTWQMYLGSAVSLFGTIATPLIRSFLTKFIPAEDIAKVFGLMGATDAVLPLISPVVYNGLYAATISTFPQSIMLLTCIINAICFILILIVKYLIKKTTEVTYQTIESGEM